MPVAYNAETDEVRVLDQSGTWAAPKMAQNPQTGEKLYLDGADWKAWPTPAVDPTGGRQASSTGFTGAMLRGATFGLSDEVAALGRGAGRFLKNLTHGDTGTTAGQAYDQQLETERREAARYAKESPVLNATGEVLGGFGAAAPARAGVNALVTAAQPATGLRGVARTATQGMATGAGLGAATGFGTGEGGLEGRLESAALGGAIGGAVGGAVPIIAESVSKLSGSLRNMMGLRQPERAAMNQVLRAFERDGVSPDDAIARLNGWVMQGSKGEMLFDLGGENVRRLARSIASVPGEATNLATNRLTARQAGQADRIGDDIASTLSPSRDFHGTVEALSQSRGAAARPLYEQAFSSGPVHSDRVAQFLDDPVMRQGLRRGMEVQRLEALAEGRPFNPRDYAITGFNDAGDPIMEGVPNMRLLDAAKRGLDDILEGYRDKTTGRLVLDERGRAIDRVRRSYVDTLDELNPNYRAARQAWSGPSQSMDAMNMGRSILGKDSEVSARQIARLSDGDREFFRAGVARELRDLIANAPDGADAVKRIFGRPAIREKLQAAFPDEASFSRFRSQMEREANLYRNAQFVSPRTGSQTQMRTADEAELARDPALGFAGRLAQGQSMRDAALSGFLQSNLYRRGQGITSETADALAPMLFNPTVGGTRSALDRMALEDLTRRTGLLNSQLGTRQFGAGLGLGPVNLLSDR